MAWIRGITIIILLIGGTESHIQIPGVFDGKKLAVKPIYIFALPILFSDFYAVEADLFHNA